MAEVERLDNKTGAAGATAPAAPGTAATSRRAGVVSRLRKNHPEATWQDDDDEAVFGQIDDDYNDYDKQIGGYKEREQKLSDMFRKDPRSAAFLNNWRDGSDPVVELVRLFGSDIVGALEDPERQEQIAEANKEYVERTAKSRELDEQYQANLQKSLEELSSMQTENGYSDEEIDDAMELLAQIVSDGIVGKFTRESIEMALKARDYDGDVAAASHAGEVRGRNARIKEQLRRGRRGDGTTALDGANSRESGVLRPNPEIGALGSMGGDDIWSRGGEKRVRRD